MRENRTYGSEGGESGSIGLPYPYRQSRRDSGNRSRSSERADARPLTTHNPNPLRLTRRQLHTTQHELGPPAKKIMSKIYDYD